MYHPSPLCSWLTVGPQASQFLHQPASSPPLIFIHGLLLSYRVCQPSLDPSLPPWYDKVGCRILPSFYSLLLQCLYPTLYSTPVASVLHSEAGKSSPLTNFCSSSSATVAEGMGHLAPQPAEDALAGSTVGQLPPEPGRRSLP